MKVMKGSGVGGGRTSGRGVGRTGEMTPKRGGYQDVVIRVRNLRHRKYGSVRRRGNQPVDNVRRRAPILGASDSAVRPDRRTV
ncbi:hypothetical protein GCM10009654_39500 [Streptomyces hebeiensis]|uniref:Uncharacterized protein n=1 Tax=Streptomyces hebeiensis TaxID=229486 RepID=A0ABP4FJY8_9ACTN